MDVIDQSFLQSLLAKATKGRIATLRPGQWEAITQVLTPGGRTLLVQATGWGKSLVYFAATLALRRQRLVGPTVVISPLLALMYDQLAAADAHGLAAVTVNADNLDDWPDALARLEQDRVDILFISPERLGHSGFMARLRPVLARTGLFVIDEAHCISDWGHDFRPDYQRLRRVVADLLPPQAAVLAATATANRRVQDDIARQLGGAAQAIRGPLARPSLRLSALSLPDPAQRYGWLAEHLAGLPGSGIIYTQTIADANRLARFLKQQGHKVAPYHSRLGADEESAQLRRDLEGRLKANDLKALVATQALGMGFDKPDLGFVVHYQRPASPVHYYQQIGRAGRAIERAECVLLAGAEDEAIIRYFIDSAFPDDDDIAQVLDALDQEETGLAVEDLPRCIALPQNRIDQILRLLAVQDVPPVAQLGGRWLRTGQPWRVDVAELLAVRDRRLAEAARMADYVALRDRCLMEFLTLELDDPDAAPCGQCANCRRRRLLGWLGWGWGPLRVPSARRNAAEHWVAANSWRGLPPKQMWPARALPGYGWDGEILEDWRAGWGRVAWSKGQDHPVDPVACLTELAQNWDPEPEPAWVCAVPGVAAVEVMAKDIADQLGLPYLPVLVRSKEGPGAAQTNDWQAAHALDLTFRLDMPPPARAVLLVDGDPGLGWALTICGSLLRRQGVPWVHPLALGFEPGSGSDNQPVKRMQTGACAV